MAEETNNQEGTTSNEPPKTEEPPKQPTATSGGSTDSNAKTQGDAGGIRQMVRDEVERALSGLRSMAPGQHESPQARENRIAAEVEEATNKLLPKIEETVKSTMKKAEEAPKKVRKLQRWLWGDE